MHLNLELLVEKKDLLLDEFMFSGQALCLLEPHSSQKKGQSKTMWWVNEMRNTNGFELSTGWQNNDLQFHKHIEQTSVFNGNIYFKVLENRFCKTIFCAVFDEMIEPGR